ncbi:hypothetical protein BB561_001162 [Smittium simulii]|uniref:NAD(P)-binding domain-containing protein n=1 Tax=Smittium simulii TaxID=133385 RepID=A0A2T9YVR8_9FUNG|nr:hypothetical protein BB561_001162 [Smittium simulii]
MSSTIKLLTPPALSKASKELADRYRAAKPNASALVLGPTGEVGREVVRTLLASGAYSKVVVATRKEIEYTGPNSSSLEQIKVDYENLDEHKTLFEGHDSCFCCLGTTRGKAGKEFFYKVDHDYVMNSAKLLERAGTKNFLLCSAANSNSKSIFYYSKVKGQVENELKDLKFNSLSIFQPAFLECDREELRLGEKFMSYLIPALKVLMPKTIAVSTSTVAKAMVHASLLPEADKPATAVYSNSEIIDFGAKM